MNLYLMVKTLHILSSVLLVGTGFGSAFYLFFANRTHDVRVQAAVAKLVVRADWWFTTPTVILQPLTGWWLMREAGWSPGTPWIAITLGLYAVAGACWLPVVWLQIKLRDMAVQAAARGTPLPARYARMARTWEWLGYPAFVAMLGIHFLMVSKPASL